MTAVYLVAYDGFIYPQTPTVNNKFTVRFVGAPLTDIPTTFVTLA